MKLLGLLLTWGSSIFSIALSFWTFGIIGTTFGLLLIGKIATMINLINLNITWIGYWDQAAVITTPVWMIVTTGCLFLFGLFIGWIGVLLIK